MTPSDRCQTEQLEHPHPNRALAASGLLMTSGLLETWRTEAQKSDPVDVAGFLIVISLIPFLWGVWVVRASACRNLPVLPSTTWAQLSAVGALSLSETASLLQSISPASSDFSVLGNEVSLVACPSFLCAEHNKK